MPDAVLINPGKLSVGASFIATRAMAATAAMLAAAPSLTVKRMFR
jgi:hypothetical protein